MRPSFRPVLALVLTLVCASAAFAQSASGSIQGTVKDETGAVLPGATVTITNTDTAHARTLATDAGGRFVAPDLPPGPYEIKAELSGFSSVVRSGVTLTVGRAAVVDLSMKVG